MSGPCRQAFSASGGGRVTVMVFRRIVERVPLFYFRRVRSPPLHPCPHRQDRLPTHNSIRPIRRTRYSPNLHASLHLGPKHGPRAAAQMASVPRRPSGAGESTRGRGQPKASLGPVQAPGSQLLEAAASSGAAHGRLLSWFWARSARTTGQVLYLDAHIGIHPGSLASLDLSARSRTDHASHVCRQHLRPDVF